MADICSPLVGVPHLDHPICTMVLYGLLSRTCDLCWGTPPCAVRLWPSAYWWWIATTRPHGNVWLFWAWIEEMAISLFTLGCTGTTNTYLYWSYWDKSTAAFTNWRHLLCTLLKIVSSGDYEKTRQCCLLRRSINCTMWSEELPHVLQTLTKFLKGAKWSFSTCNM